MHAAPLLSFRPWFHLRLAAGFALALSAAALAEEPARMPYRTFLVTRFSAHERLFPYLEAARPELVQIGYYGAMFHGYADSPKSMGTPMNLPFPGERKVLDHQREVNDKIHALGLKVIGHFGLGKAYGDWETKSGFIEYYDKRWPEDLLGPKPHADVREVLQRRADGTPIGTSRYEQAQVAFCLSSPYARKMFKQMLKVAIDRGVDGVITNYNYHFECACPYCQESFKEWLGTHLRKDELKARLGIDSLAGHRFESIPAAIAGYPDPATATPLHWLSMRWAAENFQRHFSEIFVDYGRSLKPNLLVAQWNHLSNVSPSNERMFLPADRWGKGEDFFWESGGASFVGASLNLAEHKAGDAWLSCLTLRELNGGKPFVMGKYDGIRLAASMAEGYATGGLGMGRYMAFEDPSGFDTLVRYTNFMHRHRGLYEDTKRVADAALVLPRQTAWEGRVEALNDFRALGQTLAEDQVLFDVLADEKVSLERLRSYPAVILPKGTELTAAQREALQQYEASKGIVIRRDEVADVAARLHELHGSVIEAPWTVRAAAYHQADRVLLHLVNYDRDEGKSKSERASKPENERPLAVKNIKVDLPVPAGRKVSSVRLHAPESEQPTTLTHETRDGRVRFSVPEVLVYGIVEIAL